MGIWPKSPHSHPRTDNRAGPGGGGATSLWVEQSHVAFTPGRLQGSVNQPKVLLSRLPGAEQGCRALQGGQKMLRCWGLAPDSVVVILCPVTIPSTFQSVPVPSGVPARWPQASNSHLLCLTFHTHKMKIVVQLDICCKLTGTDKIFIISVTTVANAVSKLKCIYSRFIVLRM